jgi:hypothetical protein
MSSVVMVSFGPEDERVFHVEPLADALLGRKWLDEQFVKLECEPLRASGKVLVADKLLAVAEAAGWALFDDDNWSDEFARAASAATARPQVRIDVPGRTVSY